MIPVKKLKSGFEIPALGFGTWGMGGRKEKDLDYQNEASDIQAIRKATELGMTRFDTAEIYAAGYAEEILGKALAEYDRTKLFITSKVFPDHLSYNDVIESAEASLERLKMDYLDLYLIHSPNHDIPIKDTMKALDALKNQGKIKNIGVSNFSVESFKEAQSQTDNQIILNQVHYNLIFREPVFEGSLEYCQNNDVFLEAWRPLEEGSLAKSGIQVLDNMARKYHKKPAQIALGWLLSQKNVITLFKASDLKHLKGGCRLIIN